jgi:hypothetical protein
MLRRANSLGQGRSINSVLEQSFRFGKYDDFSTLLLKLEADDALNGELIERFLTPTFTTLNVVEKEEKIRFVTNFLTMNLEDRIVDEAFHDGMFGNIDNYRELLRKQPSVLSNEVRERILDRVFDTATKEYPSSKVFMLKQYQRVMWPIMMSQKPVIHPNSSHSASRKNRRTRSKNY